MGQPNRSIRRSRIRLCDGIVQDGRRALVFFACPERAGLTQWRPIPPGPHPQDLIAFPWGGSDRVLPGDPGHAARDEGSEFFLLGVGSPHMPEPHPGTIAFAEAQGREVDGGIILKALPEPVGVVDLFQVARGPETLAPIKTKLLDGLVLGGMGDRKGYESVVPGVFRLRGRLRIVSRAGAGRFRNKSLLGGASPQEGGFGQAERVRHFHLADRAEVDGVVVGQTAAGVGTGFPMGDRQA